jgi:proton-dependent oligopeptide transporter, POT family
MNTTIQETKKKQPKSFYMIFFLEFWERFGFYGMQALLVFYFVKYLGFTEAIAYSTFGAFTALVYGFPVVGGYIGDKYFGTKRTLLFGAVTLMLGYLFLGFSNASTVFYALGLIAVGNGLFKPNPSSLLAKCYKKNDSRLHGAFTMYYMAINLGSFFSMSISPMIADHFGWNLGFMLSAIGLAAAVGNFILMRKTVSNVDSPAGFIKFSIAKFLKLTSGTVIAAVIGALLLHHLSVAHVLLWLIVASVVIVYFVLSFREDSKTRNKMFIAFVLMIEGVIFFTLYQQMPTSLNFFAIHNVTPTILGIKVDPVSFQTLNPFWIVVMSPILSILYNKFGSNKKDFKITTKFAFGIFLCSIAFLSLFFTPYFADKFGFVSSGWLVLFYFFQSTGELLVSALGVAMVAELVPEKLTGLVMGMWFITAAIAGVTGGMVASLTAAPKGITSSLQTLPIYSHVFLEIGVITFVCAVIMFAIKPILDKYISTKEQSV